MDDEDLIEHGGQVASGTFWGLFGTFFVKIISFLYTIYVARAVSQGDLGLFYLALGIVGLFGIWKDLGLPGSLTRYVPYYESRGEHRKARDLLANTIILNVISGIIFTAIVGFSAGYVGGIYQNPLLPEALRLMSLYMLLDNLAKIGGNYLQGRAEIKLSQALSTAQVLFKLVLTYMFFQAYGVSYWSLTVALLVSNVFYIAVSIVPVYNRAKGGGREEGKALQMLAGSEMWKEIVPFGIMLTIVQTFYTIISSTDRVLLGYLTPQAGAAQAVAVYSLATTLGINALVFPAAVGGIFLPLISRLVGKGDSEGIRQTIGSSQRWVLLLTLPVIAVMVAFAGEMMASFYGEAYARGGLAMGIFVLGLGFTAFSYAVGLALAGMRLVKLELKIAAIAGVANVILNFLLIPQFGIEGASFAAAASFAIVAVMMLHYGKTMIGFRSPRSLYKLALVGAALLALLYLTKPYLQAASNMIPALGSGELAKYFQKSAYLLFLGAVLALSFAIFGAMALLSKCFEKEDVGVFRSIARKAHLPEKIASAVERMIAYGVYRAK